jgi:hypothetical protein
LEVGPPVVLVRVMLGGTVVAVGVKVAVGVPVLVGVPVGTGEPAEQVGQGVARKFFSAVPQVEGLKLQSAKRLGQEELCMDQAVPPTIPEVPLNQAKILLSKVESSVLQLVEGPYSPAKTG